MTFLAAVLVEQNKPLELMELEVPALGVGQVLVKIHMAAVCGAQIGEVSGVKGPDRYLPHTLGHEGAGVVADVGPGVKHVRVGDHAICHWRKGLGIESEPPAYIRAD